MTDHVLRGGIITTIDNNFTLHQAHAIKDDGLVYVGDNQGVQRSIGPQTHAGRHPRQRLCHEEAIRAFTIWPAYAAFQETQLGSLEAGKLADLVVLDRNILQITAHEILDTQILYTMVGGEIVYQHPSLTP